MAPLLLMHSNLMWAFRATHADVSLADIDRLPSTGLGVAALPDDWRDYFKEQINRVRADVQRPSTHPSPAWPGFRPFSLREKVRESENVTSFHLIPEDGRPLPPYLPGPVPDRSAGDFGCRAPCRAILLAVGRCAARPISPHN